MQNIVFIEREYQPHILKNQNKREMGGEIYISYNIVAYNSNTSFKTKLYVKELHVLWVFFFRYFISNTECCAYRYNNR